MTSFALEKSEKSFPQKLSRRKFFGFSFSAAAAAVVAPAAYEYAGRAIWSGKPCKRKVWFDFETCSGLGLHRDKWAAIAMEPNPMFELLEFRHSDEEILKWERYMK